MRQSHVKHDEQWEINIGKFCCHENAAATSTTIGKTNYMPEQTQSESQTEVILKAKVFGCETRTRTSKAATANQLVKNENSKFAMTKKKNRKQNKNEQSTNAKN